MYITSPDIIVHYSEIGNRDVTVYRLFCLQMMQIVASSFLKKDESLVTERDIKSVLDHMNSSLFDGMSESTKTSHASIVLDFEELFEALDNNDIQDRAFRIQLANLIDSAQCIEMYGVFPTIEQYGQVFSDYFSSLATNGNVRYGFIDKLSIYYGLGSIAESVIEHQRLLTCRSSVDSILNRPDSIKPRLCESNYVNGVPSILLFHHESWPQVYSDVKVADSERWPRLAS